jgi:hypothetical protein
LPTRNVKMGSFVAAMNSNKGLGEVVNFEISIGDTARPIAEAMDTEIEIVTNKKRLRIEKYKT